MKIKLVYFGRPREHLKVSSEAVDVPTEASTLAALLVWLRLRGDVWAQELADSRVRCAINQEFASLPTAIKDNDEVAIFSPISGG